MAGYQNEEITEPVRIPIDDVVIGTFTEDYHLSEVEFERIKVGQPKTLGFAYSLLGITIGFGATVTAKINDQRDLSEVSAGEWQTLGVLAVATGLVFIIGLWLPNKRKTVLKKIDEHFEYAQTRKQAVERVTF
ncbi:hypothetical protein [Sulfitobacter sp. NAS-14.1]|uniref:hypothetical protein n=1 Tax=Sulfitobacter TaxID=60136 RepID=UPI000066B183|nr:hypothetical protein [Sulfitobacter sp. NAS-14.1]EAP80270.1 hypothetical protein NAS141_17194 [Sulfitobacter sp. NAS-14.1]